MKYFKKLQYFKTSCRNDLDIFMISETKLDETFSMGQFLMDGVTPPYRMDGNTRVVYDFVLENIWHPD